MILFVKKHFKTALGIFLILSMILIAIFLHFKSEEKVLPIDYEEYVYEYAATYDVPPELVFSVIYAESTFRAHVVSKHGAMGLMQLMPATYEEILQKLGIDATDASPFDPETNIRCGTYYLHELYVMFGRWDLVITAYNAGLGNVRLWLSNSAYADGQGGLAVIPFSETSTYLKRVQKTMPIYRDMIEKQQASSEKNISPQATNGES